VDTKIRSTYNPIRTYEFKLEIFTDASLTGWGAVCKNEKLVAGGRHKTN
jgi:hypothetical protein